MNAACCSSVIQRVFASTFVVLRALQQQCTVCPLTSMCHSGTANDRGNLVCERRVLFRVPPISSSSICQASIYENIYTYGIWGTQQVFKTWLILPVVIRLSQRLSHARLSINVVYWNCEWLTISVIVYLIVPYYMDNRSNSRANTCTNTRSGGIY